MTFNPLGNLGNQGGPPIPPEPPDPNGWRHEQDGPRRWRPPELSTTQVLIGIAVFLAIVAVVTTQLIGSGNDKVSASIVSPDEDSSYSAGSIPVRLLSDLSGSWQLSIPVPAPVRNGLPSISAFRPLTRSQVSTVSWSISPALTRCDLSSIRT